MVDWKDLSLAVLRHVAKFYNKQVKIVGVSKMKKADLTAELQKHLNLSGTTFTHKKYKDIQMDFDDIPDAPPLPAVKADKSYTKKVVARKVIQAREASVNAEAIAEQAKAMGHSITEHKKMMDDREKQVQKKGKAQARRAVGDAMAIKPPKMEEEKKSSEKEVKVKDIVRAKMDDRIYYRNRFYDNSVAYGIVKNKVMIIGKAIEDYNDLELFDKPKEIPSNVRFYTDDDKPIKTLNDLFTRGGFFRTTESTESVFRSTESPSRTSRRYGRQEL